jgi:hypothetical protein
VTFLTFRWSRKAWAPKTGLWLCADGLIAAPIVSDCPKKVPECITTLIHNRLRRKDS